MNDQNHTLTETHDELDPQLEAAVWSVLTQPLPKDAINRVKAKAISLDSQSPNVNVRSMPSAWRHQWTKIAALAACLLITFSAFTLLSSRDAFAQVVDNIRKLVTAKFTMEIHGANEIVAVASVKSPDRLRLDFNAPGNPVNITNGAAGELIAYDANSNQVNVNEIAKSDVNFDILKQLQKSDVHAVVSKAENNIPGTQLYDVFDGNGQVWIDLATKLPKRIEMSAPTGASMGATKIVYRDFEWNVPVEESLFAIPANKTVVRSSLLAPPKESELIAAFAIRHAFSQEPYEANFLDKSTRPGLRLGQLSYDLSKGQAENYQIQLAKLKSHWSIIGISPTEALDSALVQKRIDLVCMKLDEWAGKIDRTGGWVGTGVRPGESKALCWWKENGRIRELRADLTIVDATP